MGIFSKYIRVHKVTELPSTNIDKHALYVVSDGGKSETFFVAIRNMNNDHWHILEGLELGTTATTAAAGNHTHSQLHTHSNKSTLDGITPAKVSGWDDVANAHNDGKLMSSGFENAEYAPTVDPDASILAMNPGKKVGLIPIGDFNLGDLQTIIDDYIDNDPYSELNVYLDGTSVGDNTLTSSIDYLMLSSKSAKIAVGISGNTTSFVITDNKAIVKTPTKGRGIEYDADYSSTFVNRSLVDKEYVDNVVASSGGGYQKTFIGEYGSPHTSDIGIHTTLFNIGDEWIITYQGSVMPDITLDGSKKAKMIDVGVDFQPNVKSRIYLHLVEIVGTDYYFDTTITPITLLS